eukprot:7367840-Prymnesium_polylepis.1
MGEEFRARHGPRSDELCASTGLDRMSSGPQQSRHEERAGDGPAHVARVASRGAETARRTRRDARRREERLRDRLHHLGRRLHLRLEREASRRAR